MLNLDSYGVVPMIPEMEKAYMECSDDDNSLFKVPQIYFEGRRDICEGKPAYNWDLDSVLIIKDKCVVKYTESTTYEVLIKDDKGKTEWIDGKVAEIWGADIENYEDIRVSKKYYVERYDLEKAEKSKYKVTLEETSNMNDYDYYNLTNLLGEENNTSVLTVTK